jgi:hypothetical protein
MKKSTDDIARMRKKRAKQTGVLIATRAQPEFLEQLDVWRAAQPDRPSRPEALRRLAVKALGGNAEHGDRPARD